MTQTIDGHVILAMVPLTLMSWVLAKMWAPRFTVSFLCGFLSLMSIGLILSVTLIGRMLELSSWGDGSLTVSWLTDSALWGDAIRIDKPWLLNVGLFIPAGVMLTLTFARVIRVLVGLIALSVAIEFGQRWLMLGAADPADIIANFVGAALGVACATVLRRASGR